MRFIRVRSSAAGREPVRVHRPGGHEDPDDGDRDEHLPAQAHDLVVAVARERGADPDEDEHEEGDLREARRDLRRRGDLRDQHLFPFG